MQTDDLQLLAAWRGGDANAGNALVRRYYGSVLRFFEVRSRIAEDLTQRTFLACVEGRERFRGDASFRTYLFAIAHRLLVRSMSEQGAVDRLSRFSAGPAAKTSVSVVVARKQEQRLLLAVLPEEVQTVLVLHYWEGMLVREIADVLEAPVSTITTRLQRAREALRERVERLGAQQKAGQAVLADLDGWTRSLADPSGLDAIPSSTPGLVVMAVGKRQG